MIRPSRIGNAVLGFGAVATAVRRVTVAATIFAALVVVGATGATGCAPSGHGLGAPIPNAQSAHVVWNGIDVESGKDLKGTAIDEISVRGGDVIRLEVSGPVEIGERVRSGKGFAETWSTLTPQNGVVNVRASLLATAILAPKGTIARAHIGHGFDPGYGWFELEADVLAWAKGPIPGPFPPIAPPERIDIAGIAALDAALADAVAHAKDADAAAKAAHAIRSVVGLRVVRALRPVVGFPYFYDESIAPDGSISAKKEEDGRVTWDVAPNAPISFTVEGPQLLHLWSKATRDEAEDGVTLRVLEGDHERARSSAALGRGVARNDQPTSAGEADLLPLRRAIVHVPPGKHTYRVESSGGTTHLVATLSEPVIHLGDAVEGSKDEEALLKKAALSCDAGAPSICAMAMALGGRDDGKDFDAAIASASPAEKQAIATLSSGGPRDPSIALELAASQGDEKALKLLGDSAFVRIDDGLRGAWVRGTTRGTRWVTAEKNLTAGTWTSLVFDAGDSSTCALAGDTPWTEVTAEEASFATTVWRGAPTIELMATIGCDAKAPVGLVIDGETLSPNPSAPMSKWHVLVAGGTAKVRRSDKEPGHVYAVRPEAAACGGHWGLIGAPRVASTSPKLAYGPDVRAPGVEVWLRDSAKQGEIVISSGAELATPQKLRLVAVPQLGFTALDDKGNRWTRVARVALPTWAAAGANVSGSDDVAVRAIVRAPRAHGGDDDSSSAPGNDPGTDEKKEAVPLDEALLVKLSREILSAQGDARGPKYLERALVLAAGGASHAALEDARAAKSLGVKGPGGSEVLDYVKKAIRPQPRRPLVLPTGLKAYGVEPDFDPGAPRCAPSVAGPRGQIAALLDELKTTAVAQVKTFDAQLAIRAFEAVTLNPVDPRGPSVLSRALAGSRWMTPKTLDGNPLKVQRLSDVTRDGALDADGDLRARVATGQPFERQSYATITETRPAKAALSGADGAKAYVEFACVARSPADAIGATCPLSITVGTAAPLKPVMGADGRGKIELPTLPPKGKEAQVVLALDPSPGRWEAIARIVFDKEVVGTKNIDGVGWVLMPPGLQYRFLVKSGEQVGTTLGSPSLVRIDAIAEPEEHPKVLVVIDGKEYTVNVDGTPRIFAVPKAGSVTVKSIGGSATILLAERVAKIGLPGIEGEGDAEPDVVNSDLADPVEATAATTTALVDPSYTGGAGEATWKDVASGSPRPLTSFEANLGTLNPHVLGRYGTLRDGDLAKDADGYLEQGIAYRRHIETLDAWIGFSGLIRERDGNPTFAASGIVYKQFGRLRIAGWGDYWTQDLGEQRAKTIRPRAFVEYSWRLASNFFLLPRVGFDGYYTNIDVVPRSLDHVDDDVFNEFRAKHPTELFAQTLAWWVPYINDIFYLRGRATFDPLIKSLDHIAARPGAFFALGEAEVGFYADTTWYRATEGFRAQSKVTVTGATYALYNLWGNNGSVDVQTGIGGRARSSDGGWEVFALVNVFASFHRGLRDFTSLELNFPEPLGGGVAWRGPMAGGGK